MLELFASEKLFSICYARSTQIVHSIARMTAMLEAGPNKPWKILVGFFHEKC
jgi:hypothetical protein